MKKLAAGEIDLVIGTQAILYGEAQFKQLGLVVIDEQHRFGVRQRATLKQAGADPHYLVMTATPIPRTIALTLYGDLDVSTIAESPPGTAADPHVSGRGRKPREMVGFLPQPFAHRGGKAT